MKFIAFYFIILDSPVIQTTCNRIGEKTNKRMMTGLLTLILSLFLCGAYSLGTPICPVCYDVPCPGTDKSRLYCIVANSTSCGPCNASCIQCSNNTGTPYVCTCPAPYPIPPPTRSPTVSPTVAPTEEPTVAPTNAPTNRPTAPIPPIELIFAPTPSPTMPPDPPTRSPTRAPTKAPTSAPTRAPTVSPPPFNECRFCNNTSPPPYISCNDTHSKRLMLCMTYTNLSCVPCPSFCSFCYPVLAPAPSYVCTCPATSAPTFSPTRAPTMAPTVSPTGAPTEHLPDIISKESMSRIVDVTVSTVLIAFVCIVLVITVLFCCVIPDSLLWPRAPDHEL